MIEVADAVRRLYAIVDELEAAHPGRHFTLDGHLVGSIGEAVAAEAFGLKLENASNPAFDARTADGRTVEIKTSQGLSVGVQAHGSIPDLLVALHIDRESGSVELVYNGPAAPAWEIAGKPQKNGQRRVSLTRLRFIMADIDPSDQLPLVGELP